MPTTADASAGVWQTTSRTESHWIIIQKAPSEDLEQLIKHNVRSQEILVTMPLHC
jgi:hypothetical protein